MSGITQVMSFFYKGGEWDAFAICTLVFRILMLVNCGWLVVSLLGYLRRYKILQALLSKITGNAREHDRIRRMQMREELEERNSAFAKKEKHSPIIKLYLLIAKTGITEKIPGFSELGFVIGAGFVTLLIFIGVYSVKGFVVAIASSCGFVVVLWYCLSLIAYNRKIKLEEQLLQFINACASASVQYSNIIDIFGAIYEQFSAPLKEGLEECYVEAKKNNNKEQALNHLKERYDSAQFSFVIDNLDLCSSITGDYYSAARNVSAPISVYNTSHGKKRKTLRNAKINITVMFVIALGILYALSVFLGNLSEILLDSAIGNLSLISLVLLYFYGLNLKTEK